MYKEGKWASQIIALQEEDGKWGWFHSLSQFYNSPITTEQALRRLQILGFTIEDECIQKAVQYMNDCLIGKKMIPDRREKVHDWDVFTSLILSTWIRRFIRGNREADSVAGKWAEVITRGFQTGCYNREEYISAYQKVLKPCGGRILEPYSFYQVSIVSDCLDSRIEETYLDYLINRETGIYYIYGSRISCPPPDLRSRNASSYLGAIELLADYKHAGAHLGFAADWLLDNRKENGMWDMGAAAKDNLYFPLSDNWRSEKTREFDCTKRVNELVSRLMRHSQ